VLHLQKVIRGPLNVLADLVAMRRPVEKCPQDEHVQRALKKTGALLFWVCHGRQSTPDGDDGRHSTIALSRKTTEKQLSVDFRITFPAIRSLSRNPGVLRVVGRQTLPYRIMDGLSVIQKETALGSCREPVSRR
jgi:hypothetical protein